MKSKIFFTSIIAAFCWQSTAMAADLLEVYQQALISDPIYQQAISQRLSTKEGVPINLAALFPNVGVLFNPSVTRQGFSGSQIQGGALALQPRNNTARAYNLTLTATQTVFNFTQFTSVSGAIATSKGADATLNAALQSLMTRVATAYFNILRDEDNLNYNEASKLAYKEQLDQVKQQYNVGLKTITDVYTAQASYDSAVALYIGAETTLANDRENLRVITGKYYPKIAALSEDFPLITPQPANVEEWVMKAQQQNWSIKAQQYAVDAQREVIKQQFGGHLPTVTLQGTLERQYVNNVTSNRDIFTRNGPSTTTDRQLAVNVNFPIFEGGGVIAATNQAVYNYQVAEQQLEQTIRANINGTRQSYLGVISGVSQISADRQAIKSSISSLQGMEESYKVGTETLVNVLNQQKTVFQTQTAYAQDRYAFVNNVLSLKQAAGTLSFDDLRAINAWLIDKPHAPVYRKARRQMESEHQVKRKHVAMKHKKKMTS